MVYSFCGRYSVAVLPWTLTNTDWRNIYMSSEEDTTEDESVGDDVSERILNE